MLARRRLLLLSLALLAVLTFPGDVPGVLGMEKREAASAALNASATWDLFKDAQSYELGRGRSQSWRRAEELYERVMRQDERKAAGLAALAIGNHYLSQGARKKAIRYFERGAAFNEPWSMMKLAELYENGRGVKRSPRRARDLYSQVARGSDPKAKMYANAALGKLYQRPPLKNTSKATASFRKALSQGEYWSAYALAEIYGKRKRTAKNRAEIRRLLQILHDSGDPKARRAGIALGRKLGIRRSSERTEDPALVTYAAMPACASVVEPLNSAAGGTV